ncbi:hypothetical protein J7E29_08910 [Streptomyces sp. ISL-90]|nr:hypothetical protein [Streptomyces sp. ISL-90]
MTRQIEAPGRDDAADHRALSWLRLWALIAGVGGCLGMLFVLLFYAIGPPTNGGGNEWSWLGPANDVTGVVFAPAHALAAISLVAVLPRTRSLRAMTAVFIVAVAVIAVVTVLLLAGAVGFDVQLALALPAVAVIFAWLAMASTLGLRTGVLPPSIANWGRVMGVALVVAVVVALAGAALPEGSVPQIASYSLAGAIGVPCWLLYPVWWIVIGSRVPRSRGTATVDNVG